MTAADYVALAKRAAHDVFTVYLRDKHLPWMDRCVVNVFCNGDTAYEPQVVRGSRLHARLTPENTASEDALVRALLASAVTVEPSNPRGPALDPDCWFRASLGAVVTVWLPTPERAQNALLDALLAALDLNTAVANGDCR